MQSGSRSVERGAWSVFRRGYSNSECGMMLAGARADYVGKVILKYGLLIQGGVR